MNHSQATAPAGGAGRRRILIFLPLAAFAVLAALFYVRLGAGDSSRIPSPLIGKVVPAFNLPPLEAVGAQVPFTDADLRKGTVTLVNVFASWCVPCRDEHPMLVQLSKDADLQSKGVRIVGLAYKDEPANSRRFLGEMGNPYAQIGVDKSGRTGIDWGVYGVPETFVVRGDGTIAYKFIGPLSPEGLGTLKPEILKAMR
jgi:cytochrome c biogenesis protein CcmG/thiol:disulfide interchange protein DsbE